MQELDKTYKPSKAAADLFSMKASAYLQSINT